MANEQEIQSGTSKYTRKEKKNHVAGSAFAGILYIKNTKMHLVSRYVADQAIRKKAQAEKEILTKRAHDTT